MAGSLEENKKHLEDLISQRDELLRNQEKAMKEFLQLKQDIADERNRPTKYKKIIKGLWIAIAVLGAIMILTLCLFFYLKSNQPN